MVQIGASSLAKSKRRSKCGPNRIAVGLVVFAIAVIGFNLSYMARPSPASIGLPTTTSTDTTPHQQRLDASPLKEEPPPPSSSSSSSSGRAPQMQVVFSTSCSYQHDWQSYLFFFQAMMHKQPGNVTRIVSGCTEEQEQEMMKLHKEQISIMSERFHIHFTPEFGKVEGRNWQTTKYWNKPFGIKHWLESKYGYRYDEDILSSPYDDDIVVLVDPDMLMQRPFLNDFSNFPKTIWHSSIQDKEDLYYKVGPNQPIAQTYSFNDAWLRAATKGNMEDIVGPGSPALTVSEYDAQVTFSAGPPYMLTARDFYRLSYHWAKFLPGINLHFDGMMAEMYGYCTAAAHLNLRHQIAQGLMVSNVDMTNGEGWNFLEHVEEESCDIAKLKDTVPHVIHFCQRYAVGEYFISKYKIPTSILSCDHKLFELPPKDIAAYTNYSHYGDGSIQNWSGKRKRDLYRQTFMVCSIMDGLNRAATFYKDHNCPDGANYDATWNHFREEKEQGCKTVHGCPV